MWITFRTLLKGALRDRISLFYAILFPVGLLVGLGIAFPAVAYRRQLVMGLLAMSSLFFAQGGSFEILAHRNRGVYKLLRATPFRVPAFLAGLTLARGLVSMVSSLVILAVAVLFFGVRLSIGAAFLLLPVLLLGILCFSFLGLIFGNLARHEGQVNMIANLFTLPMLFGSEAFYSLAGAPAWIRAASQAMPTTHLLSATRAAMAGDAAGMLLPALMVLVFSGLFLALAVLTFRWDPDAGIRVNPRRSKALA